MSYRVYLSFDVNDLAGAHAALAEALSVLEDSWDVKVNSAGVYDNDEVDDGVTGQNYEDDGGPCEGVNEDVKTEDPRQSWYAFAQETERFVKALARLVESR